MWHAINCIHFSPLSFDHFCCLATNMNRLKAWSQVSLSMSLFICIITSARFQREKTVEPRAMMSATAPTNPTIKLMIVAWPFAIKTNSSGGRCFCFCWSFWWNNDRKSPMLQTMFYADLKNVLCLCFVNRTIGCATRPATLRWHRPSFSAEVSWVASSSVL